MSGLSDDAFRASPPRPEIAYARDPAMSVAQLYIPDAPVFPTTVLGDWAREVEDMAAVGNAPVDYVGPVLLTAAASLIGGSRLIAADGYDQPAILWAINVGLPGTGKNIGPKPVIKGAMPRVAQHMARDYDSIHENWEVDCASAAADGRPLPPEPMRPVTVINDTNPQALVRVLSNQPKGVLLACDEIIRHLRETSRPDSETSGFWLEAFDGGQYSVHRVKYTKPLIVNSLAVSICGAIQPDKLDTILAAEDDGATSRFLWAYPATAETGFKISPRVDPEPLARRLCRLADIEMEMDDVGLPNPRRIPMDARAQAIFIEMSNHWLRVGRQEPGKLQGTYVRANQQAARIALVLEYLWWSYSSHRDEPKTVSAKAMECACLLMDGYFLPMARRVLAESLEPVERRRARVLANWLLANPRVTEVTPSLIRDDHRIADLRETETIKATLGYLTAAGWLGTPDYSGVRGRPKSVWIVNPMIHRQQRA